MHVPCLPLDHRIPVTTRLLAALEALIFIAIGALITYVVFAAQRTRREARTPEEETDELAMFVHYKRRIIGTSAYAESSTYELLYSKVAELTKRLVGRHYDVLLPTDGVSAVQSEFDRYFEDEGGTWRIRRTLRIETLPESVVLVLAMYSLNGLRVHQGKKISQNRFFTNRGIEYLLCTKGHTGAGLAKGLILMYGFQEYMPPQTEAAREAFQLLGTSNAKVQEELAALGRLQTLETVQSKHGTHVSNTWRSHADLEQLLTAYHPDHING